MKDWHLGKIQTHVEKQRETNFAPNHTIYTIGDPTESVYIVKKGRIELEIFFMVKTFLNFPVRKKQY
jgi:hypothetical protein